MTGAAGNEGHESPETGHGPAYRPEEIGAPATLVAQDEAGVARAAEPHWPVRLSWLWSVRAEGNHADVQMEWRRSTGRLLYLI